MWRFRSGHLGRKDTFLAMVFKGGSRVQREFEGTGYGIDTHHAGLLSVVLLHSYGHLSLARGNVWYRKGMAWRLGGDDSPI